MPGHQIFTGMIGGINYFARDGMRIQMHVGRTHKYTQLYPVIFKIFRIGDGFNGNNFTIAGTGNYIFPSNRLARRNAEKRNDEQLYNPRQSIYTINNSAIKEKQPLRQW
jgi:hypothetical protein